MTALLRLLALVTVSVLTAWFGWARRCPCGCGDMYGWGDS